MTGSLVPQGHNASRVVVRVPKGRLAAGLLFIPYAGRIRAADKHPEGIPRESSIGDGLASGKRRSRRSVRRAL